MTIRHPLSFVAAFAFSAGFAGAVEPSWTVAPMGSTASSLRSDGELVYAYSVLGGTVGPVNFARAATFASATLLSATPSPTGARYGDFGNELVWDSYGQILSHAWYWDNSVSALTLTLNGLTSGQDYLVQIVSHNSNGAGMTVSANGTTPRHVCTVDGDATYKYGASIIGVFTASAATESIAITFAGSSAERTLNAVQVRELVEVAPTVVEPSIGSVSVRIGGATAAISLADVVMGTDDECDPATSYSVSYALNDALPVTALENQNGETVSFEIENLVDGDYDCLVSIITDKNKTASTNITFSVDSASLPLGDFNWLKTAIEGAADGATITIPQGLYTSTSTITVTASDLTVVSASGRSATIIDGDLQHRILQVNGTGFTVEGVTFKNGHVAGNGGAINYGSESASRTTMVQDCDFVDCTAKYGGAIHYGGSIYSSQNDYASFEPRANYGIVSGCTFLRCGIDTAGTEDGWGGGGAVCGALWVEDSVFDACYSTIVGGLQYHAAIDVTSCMTVTNCVFRNHSQTKRGIVGSNEQKQRQGRVRLVDCLIAGNTVTVANEALFHRKVSFDRCVISNNANTVATSLAALYKGDAAGDMDFARFTSCLFIDNQCPFDMASMPPLLNCTFVRNVGGLAYNYGATGNPAITNCVFWANLANASWPYGAVYKGVPGLYWHGGLEGGLSSRILVANTVVEGGSGNEDLAAVLAADLSGNSSRLTALADANGGRGIRFEDAANGDWTPKSRSPLVNAGVLCDWMAGARDLAGRPRAFDGVPDVGCYEHFADPTTQMILR